MRRGRRDEKVRSTNVPVKLLETYYVLMLLSRLTQANMTNTLVDNVEIMLSLCALAKTLTNDEKYDKILQRLLDIYPEVIETEQELREELTDLYRGITGELSDDVKNKLKKLTKIVKELEAELISTLSASLGDRIIGAIIENAGGEI